MIFDGEIVEISDEIVIDLEFGYWDVKVKDNKTGNTEWDRRHYYSADERTRMIAYFNMVKEGIVK